MGLLKSLFNKRNNNLENQILNLPDADISKLPKYLIYPQNLDSKTKAISNQKCGYQLMLDNELANTTPEVKKISQLLIVMKLTFIGKRIFHTLLVLLQ